MAIKTTTAVHYWRFSAGTDNTIADSLPRGWYCWVYPQDDSHFDQWMKNHCPTAENTLKFNSGKPAHIVYISDDQEALLFSLKWL